MKHITLLVIAVCSMLGVSAQTLSLADALERLNRQQSDYEISFIHNELEHLQVVADTEDMSVPKAVKRTYPSPLGPKPQPGVQTTCAP